jgi:hypothetical protein
MKYRIEIELAPGGNRSGEVYSEDFDVHIETLERAISGKLLSNDVISLIDIKGILGAIRDQFPLCRNVCGEG